MNKEAGNQFGLVYDGAITENVQGKVNIHPVNYMLNGLKIAANVYIPANFNENKIYPAIIVAHPNGGVKEQVAGLYAQNLADMGYISMAFDASYQGQSEEMPRNTDKPQNRVEDIHGAIDYIVNYNGVDRNRVGILGICGGGGYTLRASQTDKRIKAVAEKIAENLNADIFEIVPEEIYTSEDLDWTDDNSRVSKEHNDESLRNVKLENETVDNWENYDTVLIGYPIWWGIAAWPVDTFVKANDFTGKTVIPFCTSASSGLGQSGKLLEQEANSGNWLEGHRFSSNPSDSDIKNWTDSL